MTARYVKIAALAIGMMVACAAFFSLIGLWAGFLGRTNMPLKIAGPLAIAPALLPVLVGWASVVVPARKP